jgi:hypothetical protein
MEDGPEYGGKKMSMEICLCPATKRNASRAKTQAKG